jgi:hypothetical protein
MDNTNRLLGIDKTYEKEPIFPDVKEISLGEALFLQVMNSILTSRIAFLLFCKK